MFSTKESRFTSNRRIGLSFVLWPENSLLSPELKCHLSALFSAHVTQDLSLTCESWHWNLNLDFRLSVKPDRSVDQNTTLGPPPRSTIAHTHAPIVLLASDHLKQPVSYDCLVDGFKTHDDQIAVVQSDIRIKSAHCKPIILIKVCNWSSDHFLTIVSLTR